MKLVFGTLGSRALGFVREILAARFVGGGHEMDVFVAAFRIPNLVRGILGERATESAFLPVFKGLRAQGKNREAQALSADVFKLLLSMLVVLSLILALASPWIVALVGKGFSQSYLADGSEKFAAAVGMSRLLSPLVFLFGFFAFFGARLLARERFGTYAAAPMIANGVAIAVIASTHGLLGYRCLAWAVLAGAFAECIFFWILTPDRNSLKGERFFSVDFSSPHLRSAGKLWGPITFGSGVEKIGTIVETQIASFLGAGAVSALYYGNMINLLCFSVLGLSFNRSVFPRLAEQHANADHTGFRSSLLTGLRLNLLFLVPVSLFLFALAEPIVQLLLERGAFETRATARTALALRYYAVGLLAMGGMGLFSRAFYSLLDAKTPIRISISSLALTVALNFLLLYSTSLRHGALALAGSIGFWFNACLQYFFLNRKLAEQNVQIRYADLGNLVARFILPALVLVPVLWYAWPRTSFLLATGDLWTSAFSIFGIDHFAVGAGLAAARASRLLLTGFLAFGVFAAAGYGCGIHELRQAGRYLLGKSQDEPGQAGPSFPSE